MSHYSTKTFVVQKSDRNGLLGEVLAVKLTFAAAHAVAKKHAPAIVHFAVADKSDALNVAR
jgi:hypothetical protein